METDLKNLIESCITEFFQTGNIVPSSEFRVYNDTLCPDLWDENKHLDPETRVNLLRIAYDFYEKTEFKVPIIDVYFMGSSANYNWQPDSDVDVHILIDFTQFQLPPETVKTNVKNASSLWNIEHDITVKGHKVELNIQDVHEEKLHVTGIYSLTKDTWVRLPTREKVDVDMGLVKKKYDLMKQYLQVCINSNDQEKMKRAKKYLDAFRQYGLDTAGELSLENIVFKMLRADGIIKTLKDKIIDVYDQEMTVDEFALTEDGDKIIDNNGRRHSHGSSVGPFTIYEYNGTHLAYGINKTMEIYLDGKLIDKAAEGTEVIHQDVYSGIKNKSPENYIDVYNKGNEKFIIDGRTWIIDELVYVSLWLTDLLHKSISDPFTNLEKLLKLQTNGYATVNNTLMEVTDGAFIPYLDYKSGVRYKKGVSQNKETDTSPSSDTRIQQLRQLHTMDAEKKRAALQSMGATPKFNDTTPDWKKKELAGVDETLINEVLGKIFDVAQKDIKSRHPQSPDQWDSITGAPNLELMSLDNLKSMMRKERDIWKSAVAEPEGSLAPHAMEFYNAYKMYGAEIKRRLAYINKPVMNEMPQLSLHGKTAMANDETPLKSLPLNDVKGNLAIFRVADKGGFFPEGMTLVYFMDSEEAAKDMQGGKIPYLMFPRGTIHSGGSPIIDIWKKRFQKPGQEHILGVIEGNTSGEEIYIDMISVRNKWQRNHIAKMMLEFLKSKFPNAKLKTSGQTERGKKFFKSTDATEVREGMETSPGFKQWFKDSKVVNKDGTPMRVYHGTMFDFASFKEGTKNKSWFSNKTDTASTYAMYKGFDDEKVNGGARIIPLYASIQNPFIIRNDEDRKKWVNTSEDTLKSLGYDGVLFINGDEVSGYVTSSNQLKSALTNTGEYSQDPDITKEGYGAGIPEQDRLHIPGERWRIKSKDAPKTPKMVNEDIDVTLDNAVDEILGDLSKGMLTESMDVHIKGCENQFARKLNTLDGLANHLLNKSAFPFLQNLPPDQKAYYEKNRVPPYEMITPDGDYWGGEQTGTGVINFYTAGLMTQTIRKILLELNRECKRLGVSLGKMKQEPSGVYKSQVIRIPVVKNDVKPLHRPPELNMANRNAFHIFKNVLQFEPDDENGSSFSFSTQDVIERIQALKHDKGWVGQNQIQPTDSKYEPKEPVLPGDEWKHQDDEPEKEPEFDNPHDAIMHQFGKQMGDAGGGVHMMSGGLDSDSINSRIDKILEIALWAKENGYPEMYVA